MSTRLRRFVSLGYAAANRALHPAGLRLQRTDAPTRTFRDFFAHLRSRGVVPATVIDVGVGFGTPALYDAFPRAHFILVEPLEEFRPVLESLSRRLDATYDLVAAGARNGETEINVHRDLTGSSLLRQQEGAVLDGSVRRVRVVRLDAMLPSHPKRPVLIKIDTQGTELDVIEGLGTHIDLIDVAIVETSLMSFRVGAPDLHDVISAFDALGFVAYDLLEGHVRALDGALAQVDVAFVRKNSPLRSDQRFFSPAQAERYAGRDR